MTQKQFDFQKAGWKLACFVIIYSICYGCVVMFGVPSSIKFVADAAVLCIGVCVLVDAGQRKRVMNSPMTVAVVVLALFCIASAALSGASPLPVLWDMRNLLRVMIFGCLCLGFLNESRFHALMKMLLTVYWINAAMFLLQFALGARMDFLGGLFGIEFGVNGRNNLFFCIMTIYVIARYLEGACSRRTCMSVLSSSILLAALCELKIVAIEVVCIAGAVEILHIISKRVQGKPDEIGWRKFGEIAVCILVSFVCGLAILYKLYPLAFKQMTQADRFAAYDSKCTAYKLGRLTAFQNINEMFFQGDVRKMLFGFGFGSFVDAGSAALQGPYYAQYGELNYSWFVFQLNYLECGLVGVGLYCVVIVIPALIAFWKFVTRKYKGSFTIAACSITMCPIMLMLYVYNNSLRAEIAYLAFLCLAVFEAVERWEERGFCNYSRE